MLGENHRGKLVWGEGRGLPGRLARGVKLRGGKAMKKSHPENKKF